jgi:Stage II sporulation protein E (SpoIIE)/GAF domain
LIELLPIRVRVLESQLADNGRPRLPRRRDPNLAGLATFTLDAKGVIAAWSMTATWVFGQPSSGVTGRHICDVLLTGPGQRQVAEHALAEVAEGRVWTATLALTGGPVAFRCEPLDGPPGSALVIAQHAAPQPDPGWLSEASARIGTTLDLNQTAAEVVDVAVPGFADAASIFVAERLLAAGEFDMASPEHGAVLRRLAARLSGQPAVLTADLLRTGEVLVFGEGSPSFRAMRTASPLLFDRLDPEAERRVTRHPGGAETLAQFTSFLSVPLAARGSVVGCATFGRAASSSPFGPADIAAAGELMSRAAVCIDNARLYDRERRTALALQRGMLPVPGQPEVPAGLEVARCYLPVGGSVVGGDWHDIVRLPGGRAALIVGDAMGHGPEAAAVMVQLRTAAHTLADVELAPEAVLRKLDRMAAGLASPFATCIYTVIDPAAGACTVAQAGHLPPVLVLPGPRTRVLELPPGLPLGLGAESFESTRVTLPPGTTIALYTDGLVESRTRALDTGLGALREALAAAFADPKLPLSDACDLVTRAMRQHGEDEITLVLARVRG